MWKEGDNIMKRLWDAGALLNKWYFLFIIPVSYTHLDVYKRQEMASFYRIDPLRSPLSARRLAGVGAFLRQRGQMH